MNWIAQDVPLIIEAAAKSQLGVFSLAIIALSSIAYYFFRNAPWNIKLGVFIILFSGVSALGFSIIQNIPSKSRMAKEISVPVPPSVENDFSPPSEEINRVISQKRVTTKEDKLKQKWLDMFGKQWTGE